MLFCIFKFCLILNDSNSRGVFRTQSKIYDGAPSYIFDWALNAPLNSKLYLVFCFFKFIQIVLLHNQENSYEKQKKQRYFQQITEVYFICSQTLILIMQLAAFTTFEICNMLNLLSCNYVNFSHKFFIAQKIFVSRLLSNNILVPTDNNLFVPAKNKFLIIKLITNVI